MEGHELRQIRVRLKLTQAGIAELLGVTSNTVARWERGEVRISEAMSRLVRLMARSERKGRRR